MLSPVGREPTPSSLRMLTSLELGRKRWVKFSQQGRAALSSHVNARSQLEYVRPAESWEGFAGVAGAAGARAVRERTEARLIAQQRDRWGVLQSALDELSAVVSAMRVAVDEHSGRVGRAAAQPKAAPADPSTAPLLAQAAISATLRRFTSTSETPPRHLRDTSWTPPRHLRGTSEYCSDAPQAYRVVESFEAELRLKREIAAEMELPAERL